MNVLDSKRELMKRPELLVFNLFLLLCVASCGGFKSHTNAKIMDEILKTDMSHRLIMPDTILVEPDYDSGTEEFLFNEKAFKPRWFEPIGFRGSDCQRFYIHYDSVWHKGNGVYRVEGRTRYKDTIRLFSGKIWLDSLQLYDNDWMPKNCCSGFLYGHYEFEEDRFSGGGFLSGKMRIGFAKVNGLFYYDATELVSDGYENSQYEGIWSSGTDISVWEKCNWGDFRIPDSKALDIGAGEFSPCTEYLERGWRIYTYCSEDNDSLQKLCKSDKQWFAHDNDWFVPYSCKLQRYFNEYGCEDKHPSAKVVLAVIPASDEEFGIWYDIAEGTSVGDRYLWPRIIDYARADSTGIMFAYMRMGEFSDGYIAEGVFDDYIELRKAYPTLFDQYRKQLSTRWNETFDEWEKEYGD